MLIKKKLGESGGLFSTKLFSNKLFSNKLFMKLGDKSVFEYFEDFSTQLFWEFKLYHRVDERDRDSDFFKFDFLSESFLVVLVIDKEDEMFFRVLDKDGNNGRRGF